MSTTVNGTTITFSGSGVLTQAIVSNGIGTSYPSNIIINGYTSIGSNAFQSVILFLTSVTIPNTVTSIAANAFSYALYITSISIPSSVTSIGQSAFNPMSSLEAINVALSNNYYGSDINGVLFDVNGTTLIQYPIGNALTSYIIPDGVTTIVENALYGAINLTQITIPSSVTNIGANAFTNTNITSFVFSGSGELTANIVSSQLSSSQTNVLISGYTSIGANAFANAYITSISIPSSVTSIGEYAFNGTNLTSIFIPSSVTSIGQSAFNAMSSLPAITVAQGNSYYASDINGVLFDVNGTTLIQYPIGNALTSYIIPATVASIGENALYGATNLTSVTIPASVTSIGQNAFVLTNITSIVFTLYATITLLGLTVGSGQTCYGVSNVNISSLDTILFSGSGELTQDIVFAQLTTQTNVLISGYTSIEANAFEYNTIITSVTIPSSVTNIGEYAFKSISSLQTITVAQGNTYYASDINGVLFNVDYTTLIQYPNINIQTSYIIPTTVASIEANAFSMTSITSVIIPSSVTSIGEYAFYNAQYLTTVTFASGSQLTNIGAFAFNLTTSLTSVTIPASVTSIGEYAFNNTQSITSVTFASNSQLTNIGAFAFSQNTLTTITIPASVTSIGQNAFGKSSIATINVALGNSYYASDNSGVLFDVNYTTLIQYPSGNTKSSYIIPEGVTSIGNFAFSYSKISEINISPSVQTIGNNAFNGIQNLKVYSEYINNLNLIEQTYSNFYGAMNTDVILYVEPEPQPPAPTPAPTPAQYKSNGSGPIQICNSRLANCKITKTNFQNGYVMNNRATAIQRISTLISVQSQMRNATWTQIYAPVNAYSQRTGGPVGYGQSPKNTF